MGYNCNLPAFHHIRDVWDGNKAQFLKQKGWFQTWQDIALILSTDGDALFKQTGIAVWPIWGVIANLPPNERYIIH